MVYAHHKRTRNTLPTLSLSTSNLKSIINTRRRAPGTRLLLKGAIRAPPEPVSPSDPPFTGFLAFTGHVVLVDGAGAIEVVLIEEGHDLVQIALVQLPRGY